MRNLIVWVVSTLFILNAYSQSIYRYDYIEAFDPDWSGVWWTPVATTNYYTNAFVSSTSSAVLYGTGGGSSAYESDWYSLPNLVVDPNYDYSFRFRLGSYRFTSTSTTRGVDVGDYVTVQLSTDGGTIYNNELRITGNGNAYWNYNTAASYTKIANGTLTTIGPSAGGDRTSTGDGYSVIRLDIPAGVSNIAIDIFCRANAAGEEWWLDNFELWRTPVSPLPVEMLYFSGYPGKTSNILLWSTASEHNSDYFAIERSNDGENWVYVNKVQASGNSNQTLSYSFADQYFNTEITYYRIVQYDIDGEYDIYGPISVHNVKENRKVIDFTDMLGRSIDEYYKGWVIVVYDDGTTQNLFR
jgi:hypothetical protein